jgi:glyoxylase-like metal-dependent hydrolase (beta-lactamase superfamily II)
MRATNNIYVLSGNYFSAVNDSSTLGEIYGIYTPQGVVLIDCGLPLSGPTMLRETLAYFEIAEPVTHVIITHAHFDHCGGAKELQDSEAKLIVGQEDVAYCLNGGAQGMCTPFDNEHLFPTFTPDITIADDQVLDINGLTFELIKIPGHTPGSMAVRAIIDNKAVLFTGDTLQPDGKFLDSATFGWQGDPAFNRNSVIASLMKLMMYETDMIFPGHGKICLRNGTKLLRNAAQLAFLTLR